MARVWIALLLVLLPGVVLAPAWRLGGLGANEDDILYYLPMRQFFADCVAAGEFPWFNPWTGLGRPFLADPQTAVFYPPTWTFALLPAEWAYAAVLWAHYSLAGWGTYRLLRAHAQGRPAALLGAVAFAFSGFMLAHRAHFTMVHAAAWLPWVLWAVERAAVRGHSGRAALAALIVAGQMFAGHLQIAALTLLATAVFLLAQHGPAWRVWLRAAAIWALAAGLFAVQWMPTIEYLRLCTRVEHTYLQFTENSWNPVSLIGLIFPMLLGQRTPNFFPVEYWGPSHQVEQFAYPGLAVLGLALAALRPGWRHDRDRRGWFALLGFGGLLALGLYGPVCPILYWLPGANVFRVPARALLIVNLAVAALAGQSLQTLLGPLTPEQAQLRSRLHALLQRPILLGLLLAATVCAALLAAWPLLPASTADAMRRSLQPTNPALWWPVLLTIATAAILRLVVRRWDRPRMAAALAPLLLIDLGVIGWTLDVPRGVTRPDDLWAAPQRAEWLPLVQSDGRRLWTVTRRTAGGTPGEYVDSVDRGVANTNLLDRYPTLTDYGPLQPRPYARAFGFEAWGELKQPDARLADTAWMGPCNVGWVLLTDPTLPAPAEADLRWSGAPRADAAELRLYAYPEARGDVFLETPYPVVIRPLASGPDRVAARLHFTELSGRPADSAERVRVVVSRLALPGWEARVNGEPVAVEAVDDLLMAVPVKPAGDAVVEWVYRPPGFRSGATLTMLSGLVVVGLWLQTGRGRPRRALSRS